MAYVSGLTPVGSPEKQVNESVVTEKKPRRLIALQYNYSDSEDEESREERKARIVSQCHVAPPCDYIKQSMHNGSKDTIVLRSL